MQVVSLVWGLSALLGMVIALIPLFGDMNWLNIPFAGMGAIVSAIATGQSNSNDRGMSLAGLICCGIAVILGLLRLVLETKTV